MQLLQLPLVELFSPWLLPLDGEEENWPRTSSKNFTKEKKEKEKEKNQTISLTSENEELKFPFVDGKEANKMEEKKEAGLPILVWIIVIGIAAILVAGFLIFLK